MSGYRRGRGGATRGGRGRGRGMAVGYSPRNPVYKPISTREDGSVASDLSSLSDLSSRGFDKINISKETAPIKVCFVDNLDFSFLLCRPSINDDLVYSQTSLIRTHPFWMKLRIK